jgi:hypothetical protein
MLGIQGVEGRRRMILPEHLYNDARRTYITSALARFRFGRQALASSGRIPHTS